MKVKNPAVSAIYYDVVYVVEVVDFRRYPSISFLPVRVESMRNLSSETP